MDGRVIDLAERSRQRQAQSESDNATCGPKNEVLPTPTVNAELLTLATRKWPRSGRQDTAEGRLHVIVRPDDSWEVNVERAGEGSGLLLRGEQSSSAANALREIVSWLFGIPA